MRKLELLILTAAFSILTSFSALAGEWGEWKQDDTGWWYDNGNDTYENNGWSWIDQRWYYFTPEGYCLINTVTPDHYQVNESGACIVNGIVQTSGSNVAVISPTLRFIKPQKYYLLNKSEDHSLYELKDTNRQIAVSDRNYVKLIKEKYPDNDNVVMDLDKAMGYVDGSGNTTRTVCQLSSGEWIRYKTIHTNPFTHATGGSVQYTRLVGEQWHRVTFHGNNILNIDTDSIMNACVQ